ncbi:hypothetical protein [Streptomyces sp. Ac-502]|uniref:hypothetical protein n=1 Tax=Streptomyces sp. Ac-502 TaxID=3342801 RepID=UPI003862AA6B
MPLVHHGPPEAAFGQPLERPGGVLVQLGEFVQAQLTTAVPLGRRPSGRGASSVSRSPSAHGAAAGRATASPAVCDGCAATPAANGGSGVGGRPYWTA